MGKVTKRSPFVGYAGNRQQTEKKRLRDVLKKGDLYFNTGDLLRIDHENFVYFQDRVGDTFRRVFSFLSSSTLKLFYIDFDSCGCFGYRWKGENVATSEVGDVLTMVRCVLEANVYGVKVEGETLEQEPKAAAAAAFCAFLNVLLTNIGQAMKGGSAWQRLF